MKLLKEYVDMKDLDVIVENEKVEGTETPRKYFRLKGVFLQAECVNKNNRIYPIDVLTREVNLYNENKIKTGRSVGEMMHPETPEINLDRISHVIESLSMNGNDGMGVLRLIDTPMGKIAQTLVSEKILLGVSTRGVGSLDGNKVKDDYSMITPADLVFDPSAPKAFVETVMESKEWIRNGEKWVEVALENLQRSVDKKYSGKDLSQDALRYMNNFLSDMQRRF